MNKIFLCLVKGEKKVAKYIIFSLFFVFAFLAISVKGVNAAYTGSMFVNKTGFAANDTLVGTDAGDKTPVGGTLINGGESATGCQYNYSNLFGYKILTSTYKGNGNQTNCVEYLNEGVQTFYLQSKENATNEEGDQNTIKFIIKSDKKYANIVLFEQGKSLSDTNFDYDVYKLNSTNTAYEYQRNVAGTPSADLAQSIAFSGSEGAYSFTFEYTMRNFDHRVHTIQVYFYTGQILANNQTKETTLEFTLAKPLSDYSSMIKEDGTTPTTCTDRDVDQICVIYTPVPNTGAVDATHKTTVFTVKLSNSAAFYFSTINTQGETATVANIKKYNSIYATNTFTNIGETDEIVYYYFNLEDDSEYVNGITTNGYNFVLTIDASGTYKFFLVDIFGNTKDVPTGFEVKDISNRDLSIFYLKYNGNGYVDNATVSKSATNLNSDLFEEFELKDDMSVITSDNVNIGLEFYFEIKIGDDFAINGGTNQIKKNPLYYDTTDSETKNQILMTNSSGATSYYCRQKAHDSEECVSSTYYGSYFKENAFNVAQTIADRTNTTGQKAVSNPLTFYKGAMNVAANGLSAGDREKNRVNFYVNENGRFFIRIQDTQGNFVSSSIDVSIIDQYKPVITGVNTNNLCSSLYVIGGGKYSDFTYSYPTDVIASCAYNNVTYDNYESITSGDATGTVVYITRNGNHNDSDDNTNGFYDTGTPLASFNYADAIRMARIRVTDSITSYVHETSGGTKFEKSIYETTQNTHTQYNLCSTNASGTKTCVNASAAIDRINLKNDVIITNNYVQYSSELDAYKTDAGSYEVLTFTVQLIDEDGNLETTGTVCSSSVDRDACYNIVNAYIDKGISFRLAFTAEDYAGNASDIFNVDIQIIDDTNPGVANLGANDALSSDDPDIHQSNIYTECRLEIGSAIHSKNELLECYGFLDDKNDSDATNDVYNFADNSTNYVPLNIGNYSSNNYYNNILYSQIYGNGSNKAKYIKVEVCNTEVDADCASGGWVEVPNSATTIKFPHAGSYKIRFVISDSGNYKASATEFTANSTTIVASYYVNPRVLLIRPLEDEKVYGEVSDATPDFCIYASTATAIFKYNLFDIDSSSGYDSTYDFVLQNYETYDTSAQLGGLVYCTSGNDNDDTSAKKSTLAEVLANSSLDTLAKAFGTTKLFRTYATDDSGQTTGRKHNMELTTYNAYEDAGYYRITMGSLKITDTNEAYRDYVLRLHPSYLLDGETPDTRLKNYYDFTDDKYKYGTNTNPHGETISNVLYTIKQAKLDVRANGGTKVYGNPDTNYPHSTNTAAIDNISQATYDSKPLNPLTGTYTSTTATVDSNFVGAGYLGGYTVSGFIKGVNSTNDYDGTVGYGNIIQGYLRRASGEGVGAYYICHYAKNIIGNDIAAGCDTSYVLNTAVVHDLTASNVYATRTATTTVALADITYGMYIKIGTEYYKLTRNNTDLTNKKFTDFMGSKLWRYNYDDASPSKSLTVIPNTNNGNQNYYIEYTGAYYTITPRELIVQPGSYQGKEFSSPQHNDPIFELVVFGESVSISATETNGYSESVAAIGYPYTSSTLAYTNEHYQSNGTGTATDNTYRTADSQLYFESRRTAARQFANASYTYEFIKITLDTNKLFTLDGVVYLFDATNSYVCPRLLNTGTTCDEGKVSSNGGKIGVNIINVDAATSKVTITWDGVLTYQQYKLFTDSTGNAGEGKGTITRETPNVGLVGWYGYVFDKNNLRTRTNGNSLCTVDSTGSKIAYSVPTDASGTSLCSNYNLNWNDKAPKVDKGASDIKFTTYEGTGTGFDHVYKHDGEHVCNVAGNYSATCSSSDEKKIQFLIYKRDVIISFNANTHMYQYVYSYFNDSTSVFSVAASNTMPTTLTCYRKATASDTADKYTVNGIDYVKLEDQSNCSSADYGLSMNDTWGGNGEGSSLGLSLYLNQEISSKFTESTYAIPAGLYWVYAHIGGNDKIHENYNLIYIDYDALVATDGANQKAGALEITPRSVNLLGTYYQKEFGQALYETYQANGTALSTNGNNINGSLDAYLAKDSQPTVKNTIESIKIFDNHYYHCFIDADNDGVHDSVTYNGKTIKMGCGAEYATHTGVYNYSVTGNVYLYTVVSNGSGAMVDDYGKKDEIYNNFAGTPVRSRLSNADKDNDKYGLLDDAGFYSIDLSGIFPVVAEYADVDFSKAKGTIFRDTNYSIPATNGTTAGGLYITPAEIEITVTANQTKMYGCAYNTKDVTALNTSSPGYAYATGYSDCVETVAQYYDLGYEYTVEGDKEYYLEKNTNVYTSFNACSDRASRDTCSAADIDYGTSLTYTVTPNYNTATANGKDAAMSLNGGTLYRIHSTSTNTDSGTLTYDYATYFAYATAAQKDPTGSDIRFQEQGVGDYAITIGNLDAPFNTNDNACNAYSTPVTSGGISSCKNFIVKYGDTNTATHIETGSGVDTFSSETGETNMTLTLASYKFTITKRVVVITAEYNYKVYGDTEPNEGFTCAELKKMFTYTTGYGKDFATDGRSYCNADTTFTRTGVTRYYAVDNSLAKAPWTSWVREDNLDKIKYNDTLFDVINSSTSEIVRKGEGSESPAKDDAVGNYEYDYKLYLRSSASESDWYFNGNNYEINYLYVNVYEDTANTDTSISSTEPTQTSGFASGTQSASDSKLTRWYGDVDENYNHYCLGQSDGTNTSCTYSGTQVFNFTIRGETDTIAYSGASKNSDNKYIDNKVLYSIGSYESLLKKHVYFEIVRREVIIQTLAVSKSYGEEDWYNQFNVKLCKSYTSNVCTEIEMTNKWGQKASLSTEDYNRFFPSGTFSQAAFKGSDSSATFTGSVSNRAFGIYFYRTAGETVGTYVIAACATQYNGDTRCRDTSVGYNKSTLTDEAARLAYSPEFIHATTTNEYNASNYVVKPIANIITIGRRELEITPDKNQGFMYGNYETGDLIPPITYTEKYNYTDRNDSSSKTATGLVNGAMYATGDHINNQYALCLYDIGQKLTCINDRQNSSGGDVAGWVFTSLRDADGTVHTTIPAANATVHTGVTILGVASIGFNVYNDNYGSENSYDGSGNLVEVTRHALDREINSNPKQRYNRDVGTYIITAGEITNNTYCSASVTTNCLNVNYHVGSFVSTYEDNGETKSFEYVITPATIVVTPEDSQDKIYGSEDVHLKFTVATTFTYHTLPTNTDLYYCALSGKSIIDNNSCQDKSFTNGSISGDVVTLTGFAYSENDLTTGSGYNYGVGRKDLKSNNTQYVDSNYSSDEAITPKYYDKFCENVPTDNNNKGTCTSSISGAPANKYVGIHYDSVSRILLGYFYVENWAQEVNLDENEVKTHKIMNGIVVAKNNNNEVNYTYNVNMDADTGKVFTINKLDIVASIANITKTYAQATDSHKCDAAEVSGHYECDKNYASLTALDNEGRLEYNFDVTGSRVDTTTVAGKVLLTKPSELGHYYTQTAQPEYKNIHLGLTVVRKINNATTCTTYNDIYGCEDAGEYDLVFRKQEVTNAVDHNYEITIGGVIINFVDDIGGSNQQVESSAYAIVDSTNTSAIDESNGLAGSNAVTYTVYKSSDEVDTVPTGQDSNGDGPQSITVIDPTSITYKGKLTITKRNVTFYIGTYAEDGTVAYRYVIEQNEQIPQLPALNAGFTTSITDPKSKQVYFVTWFDGTEYDGSGTPVVGVPRQIRTGDKLITSSKDGSNNVDPYGIALCKDDSTNIQGEKFGVGKCTADKVVYYHDANTIDPSTGEYKFSTSKVGEYAIIRNQAVTYIGTDSALSDTANTDETKNYTTHDHNGTLIIYEDETPPTIQIGNTSFVIEANAHNVISCAATNTAGALFNYNGCSIGGLKFDETDKPLGDIIKFITNNFSGYDGKSNYGLNDVKNDDDYEDYDNMPSSISQTNPNSYLSSNHKFMPVNNVGASGKVNTLYKTDRTVNTYAFAGDVIGSETLSSYGTGLTDANAIARLRAISSIISWFNINSYDYSYVRGDDIDDTDSKRYTPRYYFYIDGLAESDNVFDPTYVGDFTVHIYAIDNVKNKAEVTVTLKIEDTTVPETGELHVFNAPVTCGVTDCKTNTVDSWYVTPGVVSIDSFIKYVKNNDGTYTENNTNGTYIYLNGGYKHIFSDAASGGIVRYSDSAGTIADVLGRYVKVVGTSTPAVQVEHKYWSNNPEKYLVVVGGKDNSYIDPANPDVNSQWDTYYTVDDGDSWYRYPRRSTTGVKVSFKEGNTAIYTRVLDTGRDISLQLNGTYEYYNDLYLRYIPPTTESGLTACSIVDDDGHITGTISGCVAANATQEIIQIRGQQMTLETGTTNTYTVRLHSILVTFVETSATEGSVTWDGIVGTRPTTAEETNATGATGQFQSFKFGIMVCYIDVSTHKVDCATDYHLVYRSSSNPPDKVSFTNAPVYGSELAGSSRNIGAWDVDQSTKFNLDRRHIFIDTGAPVVAMKGHGYSVYEYDTSCELADTGTGTKTDSICDSRYQEEFVNATDGYGTTNTTTTITDGIAASGLTQLVILAAADSKTISWYTGDAFSGNAIDPATLDSSGLLANDTLVMSGSEALNTADGDDNTTFNKYRVNLLVYLSVQKAGEDVSFYRYTAIYDGTKYLIYRQTPTSGNYSPQAEFTGTMTGAPNVTTIESVLEFIVSTASVTLKSNEEGKAGLLTFSVNYQVLDAAGNASELIDTITVRGITFAKLSATITPSPAVLAALENTGNNTYSLRVNEGTSISKLLTGFEVSYVDIHGESNNNSIAWDLYHDGERLRGNIGSSSDILDVIDGYNNSPGVYTLRFTSRRQVEGYYGDDITIEDKPLEINFIIEPPLPKVIENTDYSSIIGPVLAISLMSLVLFSMGYISIKKRRN